ncbi:synaptotagmin-5-like isoform X2 [Andrographis paniculata]|uniref:synaptotagmin-5-like isoform X2 n=1 Tax=Andrographis paniculata TaxID=175694 RepID=UPI0021E98C95|nr:synaptotagmin-5-like isoform X2 [Andrographis paniculata]
MGRTKKNLYDWHEAMKSLSALLEEQPLLPFVVPLLLVLWAIEKWFFHLSNWVLLGLALWTTIQYGNYQRRNILEDLNKKWMQITLQTLPVTPLEHCEWTNKLLIEIWPNYISPKLSSRFASIVEEKIELQEFSLGSRPPLLGLHGTRWATSGDQLKQQFMRFSFDWDTEAVNIILLAKLATPLMGTARIAVNSIHIKGDIKFIPILEGKAILYSFISTPEVRLGVAFGSGGSQSLPATELPGVSSWLVKLAVSTLNKRMVEPRRQCLTLPAKDLHKKALVGALHVAVISANKLSVAALKSSASMKQTKSSPDTLTEDHIGPQELQTFLEIELGELTRRTSARPGSNPKWDAEFNLILHDSAGTLKFNLYAYDPGSVRYNFLTSCEVRMRYVPDDSTIFWAIGPDSSMLAKHAEFYGKEIEMTVPFENSDSGELTVRLALKEWQFSDGSHSMSSFGTSSSSSPTGSSNQLSRTGRRICITVVEGKDLIVKDKVGKSAYVKLQYGKAIKKTKVIHSSNPAWNQKFEFDELSGEYLKIKCHTEETFGDEFIGSARLSLEGLVEGSVRNCYVPLEKVDSGELWLQMEAFKAEDNENSKASLANGWIEVVIIEARDLVAADLRGTSDPYVKVQYGNLKKNTKVVYKTLNPKWHQTLDFPNDGSPLTLYVKDHNTLMPTSSIGECVVEYQMLPPNQMADKWIPLQGVKRGEIHVQVTRKVPELEKKPSTDPGSSPSDVRHHISNQVKELMSKLRSQIEEGDVDRVLESLSELETLQDTQEEFMVQLEMEQMLMLNKVNELGQEILNSSSPLSRATSIT